jgi:predicted phage tail component-like protein
MTDITLNGAALSDEVPEAEVLRVTRPIVGARREQYVEVPGRAGSVLYPEEPGDRSLTIAIHILGDTFNDRRDAVRRLADWADIGQRSRLVIDDEPDRFHEAILAGAPTFDEWLTSGSGDLEFRTGPYALALAASVVDLTLPDNSGTFPIDDDLPAFPVVEITPTDGTITSFTFELNDTSLSYAGLVNDDATITISSLAYTVTQGANTDINLTGAFDIGAVDLADVSGTFPVLLPGTNAWTLTWDGTATTVDVRITWRRRHR